MPTEDELVYLVERRMRWGLCTDAELVAIDVCPWCLEKSLEGHVSPNGDDTMFFCPCGFEKTLGTVELIELEDRVE